MSAKNKIKAGAFIVSTAAVPGAVAYFGWGTEVGLIVAALFGGFFFGLVAGISLVVVLIAEPNRFPNALDSMKIAVLMRRTKKGDRP